MLNSNVKVIHRGTITRDLYDFYEISKAEVAMKLQGLECMLTLGIDGWTSPMGTGFIAILVHYREGDVMKKLVLDFVRYVS